MGQIQNVIFPTSTPVSALPQNLIKASFTDVKDADGAKFLYEELPKLQKVMKVNVSEAIEKLFLEQNPQ